MIHAEAIYYDSMSEPDIESIRRSIKPKTKAIVVINPNNPTGAVYSYESLKAIVDIAKEYNLVIIADEVYDHLVFSGVQMHKLKDIAKGSGVPVFSGNSLSKNFFYPAARVGYIAVHNDDGRGLTEAFVRLGNKNLSDCWPSQRGAIAAYEKGFDFLAPSIVKLEHRGKIICDALEQIPGLSVAVKPQGAMYVFVKVDGYVSDGKHDARPDWNFVYELLNEKGILVVPGSAFYKGHEGEIYFRTTLLPDEATMQTVVERLGDFMKTRYKG
jgi:alanine-synthesizing transaminase